MKVANLRHQIDLQSQTKTADDYGGFTAVWTTENSNVWAEIAQPSGSDVYMYGRMIEKLTTKITIRYNSAVRMGWQAVFGDRTFSIRYVVDQDGRRKFTTLFCDEML